MPPVKASRVEPPPSALMRHRFGAHLSIAGGLHKAIAAAQHLRFDALQVFVKNQRQWRAAPLKADDLRLWFKLRESSVLAPPIAHATYLINLAAADDRLNERSRLAFADELLRADTLEIPYLVIHPGAAGTQSPEEAIARVARALDRIFADHPNMRVVPLLEGTAGQGSSLGRTFAELGEIIRQVQEPSRVGVCLDTCHLFAAGYDLRDTAAYDAAMREADRAVGLARVRCWHFNDSKAALGAHVDRHEHIGLGQIGDAGFRNILADPRFRGLPMICETPKGTNARGQEWDVVNVRRLRRLAAQVDRAAAAPKPPPAGRARRHPSRPRRAHA